MQIYSKPLVAKFCIHRAEDNIDAKAGRKMCADDSGSWAD
jgi:hypothetical protein